MTVKVLIIEDVLYIRDNIVEMLQLNGIEAFGAANGTTGIEMVRKLKPDVVICDILMPDIDGYEVLKTVRADRQTARLPFIFITAVPQHEVMEHINQAEFTDCLIKPFNESELLNLIRRYA